MLRVLVLCLLSLPAFAQVRPNAPTGITVTSGVYTLSWSAVADKRVTGYRVYWAAAPFSTGVAAQTIPVTGTALTFSAASLQVAPGTTVYMAVSALGNGIQSPLSSIASATLD